ncbi:MAG: DivIVA domain-containing protein [Mogibacterium sp.]|nr:DivIVA domain-containing protein [Mogibacterium sp.]
MIMPIDIDKKEFTRDKRGYNSREVDEFLDLIIVDYEKVLNDNRKMANKIKFLEKQLEEAQKSDTAMLETLETAKRLMADISASAERRAELMIRDAELEAETMILDAKATVRKINDEHIVLRGKVERLRKNYRRLLEAGLEDLDADEYALNKEMDRSDLPELDREFGLAQPASTDTLVVRDDAEDQLVAKYEDSVSDPSKASVADLSDSLRKMAEDKSELDETIILK